MLPAAAPPRCCRLNLVVRQMGQANSTEVAPEAVGASAGAGEAGPSGSAAGGAEAAGRTGRTRRTARPAAVVSARSSLMPGSAAHTGAAVPQGRLKLA
jgi:hypothetical protein